jgi:hypothetical protein
MFAHLGLSESFVNNLNIFRNPLLKKDYPQVLKVVGLQKTVNLNLQF